MEQNKPKKVILEKFAFRLFDPQKTKNYINCSKDEFVNKVNELFTSTSQLKDGYAPFCKHIFITNFVKGYKAAYVQITPENEKLIKTKYASKLNQENGKEKVIAALQRKGFYYSDIKSAFYRIEEYDE